MSYSQNKEEINKVFQLNSLNNRGRFFLRTEDYEGARECFLSVLEIDDKNYDALINLLMIDGSYRSIEELIGHYQNLYTEEDSERVIACEFADDQIEELKEKYCIEGYLSEEQIDELFEYKEDITYESRLESCARNKQDIENEIKNNAYLSKLSESEDSEAKELIGKILEPYNRKLEEAENSDQYEKIKIATNYRRFVEKQSEEVKELAKGAEERRNSDYNSAIEKFYQADKIEDFEEAVEVFKGFKGYKEAEDYIRYCHEKIEEFKARQKELENQTKVRELLNQANECLKNKEFEKADDLYFEVISIDSDNVDAYMGTLLAENKITSKDELSDVFFKTDYTPIKTRALNEQTDTVDRCIEKYYLPEYMEKEAIKKVFAYDDFYFDSYYQSAIDKKEELKKEFENNQTIKWLMDHDDNYISNLYRDLIEKYDKQIEEFKNKDELETVNKTIKYQRFIKNANRDIKRKYDEAIKAKEDDYQKASEILHAATTVKEIKEVKRILNRLGDYKDSKDLLFEALNRTEELKAIEKEAELKKQMGVYIEEAASLLKQDQFEEADLLFQKVYSYDSNNVDARIGFLMVENECHDIDELLKKYQKQYSVSQFEYDQDVINGKSLIEDHIKSMAEKYSVPNKLDKNVIINLYNNDDIFYNSISSKLEKLKETLSDDISIDENLTWICEQENNQLSSFFKELNEEIDKAIINAKKEEKENKTKTKEKYQKYAKQIDSAVKDLYKRIINPEGEEEKPEELKETESESVAANKQETGPEEESSRTSELVEKPQEEKKLKFSLSGPFNKAKEERLKQQELQEQYPEVQETETKEDVVPESKQVYTEPVQQQDIIPAASLLVDEPKKTDTVKESEPEKEKGKAKEKPKKEKKKKEKEPGESGNNVIIYAMAAVMLVLAFLIVNIVYRTIIKPNNLYNEALELVEAQQYNRAIEIFEQLGDYKDSAQLINETYYKKATSLYEKDNHVGALEVLKNLNTDEAKAKIKEIKNEIINKADVGDTIIFGEYEQDGDKENGREYIEWEVLDIEDNKLLIISRYCLDVQKYNDKSEATNWKFSTIRSWLNGRFAANAFDSEDPAKVPITNLYSISSEDETEDQITNDRIFLLGREDIEKYYPQEEERLCQASESLKDTNLFIDGNGNCSWWLRDGITKNNNAAITIGINGQISEAVYEISSGIRPVMWINTN